ncbi:hypothetical protein INR49_001818, partial [Caranx melampygus]
MERDGLVVHWGGGREKEEDGVTHVDVLQRTVQLSPHFVLPCGKRQEELILGNTTDKCPVPECVSESTERTEDRFHNANRGSVSACHGLMVSDDFFLMSALAFLYSEKQTQAVAQHRVSPHSAAIDLNMTLRDFHAKAAAEKRKKTAADLHRSNLWPLSFP